MQAGHLRNGQVAGLRVSMLRVYVYRLERHGTSFGLAQI